MQDYYFNSPFFRYRPKSWFFHSARHVYSSTQSHGLRTKIHLQNLSSPINENREEHEKVLISYEVEDRLYDLYTLADLERAAYAFNDVGFSNMKGDLGERIARRVMKRFLQRFDSYRGKLGGLFDKRFNPKSSENYVVANTDDHILKIGRYPNMILLKKTGHGKWGYQHVTDLDGLFDYRYLGHRHLIIIESKIGKIDTHGEQLYENLFVPLKRLFPNTSFTYVMFANKDHLLDRKYPEYRILQDTPVHIYEELSKNEIPCFFFEFKESGSDLDNLCKHLITTWQTYHHQQVQFQGQVSISDQRVVIFNPGSRSPYLELHRNPIDGRYDVIHSARLAHKTDDQENLPDN